MKKLFIKCRFSGCINQLPNRKYESVGDYYCADHKPSKIFE